MYIDEKYVGKKLETYLKQELNYSGRQIRKMRYFINGIPHSYKKKIQKIGQLKIEKFEEEDNIAPIKMDLDVVFENEDILIVNKPAYLLVHPTQKIADITLANGIKNYFLENDIQTKVRFFNRLDMNTSGLIIIAKSAWMQSVLQSEQTKITKKYLALVENTFDENEFVIEENILQVEDEIKRIVHKDGKYAKTIVKVIKNYPKLNIALVECEILTGRTHQIRVHLSHISHPILGDTLYGSNENTKIKRQMLHSYYLKVYNSKWGINIELKIDLPKDIINLIP